MGYVHNSYTYDTNKLELIKDERIPRYGIGEGAPIHKKYTFKLLNNEPSIIYFKLDYIDEIRYEKFAVDANNLIVYRPCIKNLSKINSFENKINNPNSRKCISNSHKCIIS